MRQFFEFLLPKHLRTPVPKPLLGKTKIIHKTRLIDKYNIDAYRECLTHGSANTWANEITIYHYEISPFLTLSKNDIIYKKLKDIEAQRSNTLAHETRHIHNGVYRAYHDSYDNPLLFDNIILDGLDEISAFTYGSRLNGQAPETWDELWAALCGGIDDLMAPHKTYRRMHSEHVMHAFYDQTDGKSNAHKIRRLNKLLVPGPIKYSRGTQIIADYFLTFGDYRVLAPDVTMPTEVKNKLRDFRDEWEALARAKLLEIRDDLIR